MSNEPYVPGVKQKRIALLNGICAVADRLHIEGQVVDIPLLTNHEEENYDPIAGLPGSMEKKIRPIQDMGVNQVRRPRLVAEIIKGPPSEEAEALFVSEEFHGDSESFFSVDLDTGLPPGDYYSRIRFRGLDSIRQSVTDIAALAGTGQSSPEPGDILGYGLVRILPGDHPGMIVTSDIDQTFLDTSIESRQGLAETLFETAASKRPLPGMPALYHELQKTMPLKFISASPHFFRRTLTALFKIHKIDIRELHLKYLMGMLNRVFSKTFETVLNLQDLLSSGVGGAFDRTFKFMGSTYQSLFDQVAYKLTVLLESRKSQPTNATEVLMGDNTESDYFIFTFYQAVLTGMIQGQELENYLYHLRFKEREALTRDSAKKIRSLQEACLAIHGPVNPVRHVWINMVQEGTDESMKKEITGALPETENMKADELVYPVACKGATGFALAALDNGLISTEQFETVVQKTRGGWLLGKQIDDEYIIDVIDTFNFHSEIDAEGLKSALLKSA